jgi:hypothetical protein
MILSSKYLHFDNTYSFDPKCYSTADPSRVNQMMADSASHGFEKEEVFPQATAVGDNNRTNENPENPENESENQDDVEENGPTSSVGNIIPLKKLQNGWAVMSSFMSVSRL